MRCSIDNGLNTTDITEVISKIINVLTPIECLFCETEIGPVCYACYEANIEPTVACCYSCRARSDNYETCRKCRTAGVKPKYLWAAARYDGLAAKMVYQMKFDSNRAMAELIADKLHDSVPFIDFDMITYLPTASSRLRKRGYDHSRLIASTFARRRGLPFGKLLVRIGQARQVGASKADRKKQAEASYLGKPNLQFERALVIDDVISSGASIEAATRQLRRAGVRNVYAAVFARK